MYSILSCPMFGIQLGKTVFTSFLDTSDYFFNSQQKPVAPGGVRLARFNFIIKRKLLMLMLMLILILIILILL